MMRRRILALLLGLLGTTPGLADEASPLVPGEVLASSGEHFPRILESLARRRAAEGDALEARGEFDLVFEADGFSRVSGYYDGNVITGMTRQRFRGVGASVYAGYKLSDGDFPIYEDEYYTNSGGEMTVGVLFSLLRDREIDSERFGLRDTELALREADQELLMTRIGVQRRSLEAYWRWVTAGRQLRVYENLLRIAQERESGLRQQVESGARAEIFLVENRQNLTRRQTLVTAAERDFRVAANELSYYYRDEDGSPRMPPATRLPPAQSTRLDPVPEVREGDATGALLRRPELLKLRATISRVRNKIALAENSLKPRLDLNRAVDHDFGGIAEGGVSRDATDTKVGFQFSVPLQQRKGRGQVYAAEAELFALQQEQRRKQDEIEIEVRNILISLDGAEALLRLAEEQVVQTEVMRNAEQRRFESGASDFFLVNIREETAANAEIQFHLARLEREIALADYFAATVDLDRLGIDE
jgi:outer membrane protein TolC